MAAALSLWWAATRVVIVAIVYGHGEAPPKAASEREWGSPPPPSLLSFLVYWRMRHKLCLPRAIVYSHKKGGSIWFRALPTELKGHATYQSSYIIDGVASPGWVGGTRVQRIHSAVFQTFTRMSNFHESILEIDHMNQVKTDNRFVNLQAATDTKLMSHLVRRDTCR
jgi:hypothetical protein